MLLSLNNVDTVFSLLYSSILLSTDLKNKQKKKLAEILTCILVHRHINSSDMRQWFVSTMHLLLPTEYNTFNLFRVLKLVKAVFLSDSAILNQQPSKSTDFMCCHHPLKLSEPLRSCSFLMHVMHKSIFPSTQASMSPMVACINTPPPPPPQSFPYSVFVTFCLF